MLVYGQTGLNSIRSSDASNSQEKNDLKFFSPPEDPRYA